MRGASVRARRWGATDMIGTTRFMTNASGNQFDPVVYTAFGERISGTNHRYGYAGAYGYQAHDEFPLLHVGHRYYDPSTGRFLQRDPVGIRGGFGVYDYVNGAPTGTVDPSGLWWWGGAIAGGAAGAAAGARSGPYTLVACTVGGFIVGGLERGDLDWITDPRPSPPPRGRCTRGCHGEDPPEAWPAPDPPPGNPGG